MLNLSLSPSIPFPPLLLSRRAACYRFDSDSTSWKERGRGDVKLLQNKETKSIRILLRQEKTLKLCMNHKGQNTHDTALWHTWHEAA